jgi:MFS family permease
MIPIIVPEEKRQGANAALGFGSNIAFMLGTVSGGLLVTRLGPGYALAIDAITFFIAGALVYPLRKLPQPGQFEAGESISFVAELKLGWVEFKSRSWLVAIVVAFAFINAAVEALWAVLGALQAAESYDNGPAVWSMILGAMSIGFLLGTLVANKIRPKHPLTLMMLLYLVLPVFLFAYGTAQPLWVVFIAATAMGLAQDVFYVMWSTVVQQNVPEDKLSRVNSYDTFGSFLIGPLGMLVAGPLALVIGVETTMLWTSAISLVAVIGALLVPSVRRLELKIHD